MLKQLGLFSNKKDTEPDKPLFLCLFPLVVRRSGSQPENKSSNLLRDTRYVVEPELISLKYIGYLYRQSGQTYTFRARTYFF